MPIPTAQRKGIKNMLRDCKACPEEEKAKLIQEYVDSRKRQAGKAQLVRASGRSSKNMEDRETFSTDPDNYSIMFTAVFGSKYRDKKCADNGADGNIIDAETLRNIADAVVDCDAEVLRQPRLFYMAASNTEGEISKLVCTKTV